MKIAEIVPFHSHTRKKKSIAYVFVEFGGAIEQIVYV